MGRIQRFPTGFLSLLDGKAEGRSVADWSEFLQPTLDNLPFLLATAGWQTTNATETATTYGDWAAVTVPAGEVWLVMNVTSNVTAQTAGDDATFYCTTDYKSPTLRFALSQQGIARLAVNFDNLIAVHQRGMQFRDPLIALPGQRFFTHFEKITTAAAGFLVNNQVAYVALGI